MKAKHIVKIVVWAIIAILLCSLLAEFLSNDDMSFGEFDLINGTYYRPGTGDYNVGDGEFATDEKGTISSINIDWVSGKVNVVVTEEEKVQITETYEDDIEQQFKMRWDVVDGKLCINYRKSSNNFFVFFTKSKTLTVKIPKTIADNLTLCDISTRSANLSIDSIKTNTMIISSASAEVDVTNSSTDKLEIDTASGRVNFKSDAKTIDINTASGNVTVYAKSVTKIDSDSASAKITVYVPSTSAFVADFDSLSGKFVSDFSCTKTNGKYICGTNGFEIDADSASGNFELKKLD